MSPAGRFGLVKGGVLAYNEEKKEWYTDDDKEKTSACRYHCDRHLGLYSFVPTHEAFVFYGFGGSISL